MIATIRDTDCLKNDMGDRPFNSKKMETYSKQIHMQNLFQNGANDFSDMVSG